MQLFVNSFTQNRVIEIDGLKKSCEDGNKSLEKYKETAGGTW